MLRMFRFVAVVVSLLPCAASALYTMDDAKQVPINRVITNLTKQLQAADGGPNDKERWLNLGRAHAMAAFVKSAKQWVREKDGVMTPWWSPDTFLPALLPLAPPALSLDHMAKAIDAYRRAESIDAKDPVVLAGLGWLLIRDGRRDEAKEKLRAALEIVWREERAKPQLFGSSFAEEIIQYLAPLLDRTGEKEERDRLKGILQELSEKPRMVTPIVVPLRDDVTLNAVTESPPVARFDADGSGIPRTWTWIRPDVGWLVFAPSGKVSSALQLFGSVTFWMFWKNGYHALRALDDDDDGEVAGAELNGLSLWVDRNTNGVTDDGELIDVRLINIAAISCRGVEAEGVAAMNAQGVRFLDGSTRPTWDILLSSAAKLEAARTER